jgi:hypothetical protein
MAEENAKWRKNNSSGIWAGSWAGDRIAVVGDQTYNDFLGVEALKADTNPIILDDIIELEFENISGKLICWLVNDEAFAEWLLKELNEDRNYIGNMVISHISSAIYLMN